MPCQCSICRNGGVPVKPPGCRCPGQTHANMSCFITKPEHPTIGELLRQLGLPMSDEGIRQALLKLVVPF